MTPPEAPEDGNAAQGDTPPAVSVCLDTLRKRDDFLRAARARRQVTPGFILQARRRDAGEIPAETIRVGFTASKKVGNAVARNRAKRRLRAIAHTALPVAGKPGWDYVLIARATVTAKRPFALLSQDLDAALAKIHATRKPRR